MTMLETFLKPMHKEGYKFVGAFAVATLLLFWLWEPLGWIGVGLTVWCYYFFRDPKRAVPQGEGLMVSPADGVVSLIERAVPPPELGMGPEPPCEPRADRRAAGEDGLPPRQVPERLARQGERG